MSTVKATIITIGDELLIGQTIDTNSAWMAQRLNELGIDIERRVTVTDTKEGIKLALDEEIPRADIILMTGGLGPTADDITKPFLSEYFGGELVVDQQVLTHVKELFAIRNRPFLERNLKQAEVPNVCTVLFNKVGTAPGMLFESNGKFIVSMPGVPFEMMDIMTTGVLPRLKEKYISDAIVHQTIITSGEGESFIAEHIKDIEEQIPVHIKLAYLPSPGIVKLRLTGRGANQEQLEKEIAGIQSQIKERIDNIVVAEEDIPLQEILGRALKEKGATVCFAESCTGGYVSHLMTQVQGSSSYFNGAIVPYQSKLKHKVVGVDATALDEHSAISEEVAIELANKTRVLMDCDYCLSLTGQLSYGGEDDHIESGVVWMAVADKDRVETKRFKFHYDRWINKEQAAQMGMLMMWKFVNNKL